MKRLAVLLLLTVAACGKSATAPKVTPPPPDTTGTKLHDPTVDIYNNSPNRAYFDWASGLAVLGADTIPAFTHRCEAFTAIADSAFWKISDTSTATGAWAEQHTAYFDPASRPMWNIAISEDHGIIIIAKDTSAACTP